MMTGQGILMAGLAQAAMMTSLGTVAKMTRPISILIVSVVLVKNYANNYSKTTTKKKPQNQQRFGGCFNMFIKLCTILQSFPY